MPSLIPDAAAFERRLAGLPVVKHPARQVVLTAGSKTGRLFFLRSGAVEVIKDGEKIADVSAPGSVFGEQAILLDQPHTADVRTLEQSEFYVADAQAMLAGDPTVALYVAAILARQLDAANRSVFGEQAILLDQPHTADVRTLEQSEFYVADAQAMLAGDPTVALYVAAILARRLDAANRSLIEVKHQLHAGESLSVIGKTVEKVEELLSHSGDASLVYAGYPSDPFRPDKSVH